MKNVVLRSGLLISANHHKKRILTKLYTICSSHQLGLGVELPELSTTLPIFIILQDKKNVFSLAVFSASIYRAGGSIYEVSYL